MVKWNDSVIMLLIYQSALFAVLSFIMYFRNGNHAKKFLGWFMVMSALFALYKGAYTPGLYHVFWYLFPLGIPLFLSFFPIFYFYIKSLIIREYQFTNKEFNHLYPALLLFLLSLPYYVLTFNKQVSFAARGTGLLESPWLTFLKYTYYLFVYGYFNFQVIFYSIKIAKLYRVHKLNLESSFSDKKSIKLSWIIILTLMIIAFLVLLDLSYFIGMNDHEIFHTWINLAIILITLFFAVFGILQKDIYPHREITETVPAENQEYTALVVQSGTSDQDTVECAIMQQAAISNPDIEPCDEEDCCRVKKYAGSGLTERQKKALGRKLDRLMREKYYLNGKLTIDELAEKLDTNSKYLSQVINELHQQNFYTYINSFRIEEAQRLLKEQKNQKYSIHGIARLAGFSSKSSFNEAFRRIVGMTPSKYLEKSSEAVK